MEKKTKINNFNAIMIQESKFIVNETKYLKNVLNLKFSFFISLKKIFSKKNKNKFSIVVNSRISTLYACLATLRVGYVNDVIMPSFVTMERNAKYFHLISKRCSKLFVYINNNYK